MVNWFKDNPTAIGYGSTFELTAASVSTEISSHRGVGFGTGSGRFFPFDSWPFPHQSPFPVLVDPSPSPSPLTAKQEDGDRGKIWILDSHLPDFAEIQTAGPANTPPITERKKMIDRYKAAQWIMRVWDYDVDEQDVIEQVSFLFI
jgi:hypothetical protein